MNIPFEVRVFRLFGITIISAIAVSAAMPAYACDKELQPFPRDCAIQDKFRALRKSFERLGVDIEEIAEYRAIRFIARGHWDNAKTQLKGPRWCYSPAPLTWDIWDSGMRSVEAHLSIDQITFQNLPSVHKALLKKEIQAKNTAMQMEPGEYRTAGDPVNGFPLAVECKVGDTVCENYPDRLRRIKILKKLGEDNLVSQQSWEQSIGETFSQVVSRHGGPNSDKATTFAELQVFWDRNKVLYPASENVPDLVQWMMIYKDEMLEKISNGKSPVSPIQLAAQLQRWLVSIHPFADGNGRLSRAFADLLLKKFDLPKAPAGDLQNDVLELHEDYRKATYEKMEAMLESLKPCLKYHRRPFLHKEIRAQCATVAQLKNDVGDQNVECSKW